MPAVDPKVRQELHAAMAAAHQFRQSLEKVFAEDRAQGGLLDDRHAERIADAYLHASQAITCLRQINIQ